MESILPEKTDVEQSGAVLFDPGEFRQLLQARRSQSLGFIND
jgi:hypothetical protein